MQETSWKTIAGYSLLVILLVGLAVTDWLGLQSINRLKQEVAALRELVIQAEKIALEESSAANAANQRATEAAKRADDAAKQADEAAGARQTAEQKSTEAQNSAQQANQVAAAANEEVARLHREREQELNHMREALSRVAETRRTPQGMVIVLPDSTFRFPFDKADLSNKNRELLSRVAGILLASKGYGLSVFGYTDDVGSDDYNQKLSLRRAEAVQQYLVEAGLDPAIINRKGYGKSSPVTKLATPEGRAKNRRVEIAVTDSSIKYGDEVAPVAR